MGRWAYLDSDEERLPEGMTRVGYDADEGVYTYRDANGSRWQGVPGSQYGPMFRVKEPSHSSQPSTAYVESNNVWNNLDPTGQNGNADNVNAWLNFESDPSVIEEALNSEGQLKDVKPCVTKPISLTSRAQSPLSGQDDEDDDRQINHKNDIDTEPMEEFPGDQARRRNRYLERQKRTQNPQGQGGGLLRLGRLIEDILPSIASSKSGLSRMSSIKTGVSRRLTSSTGKNRRNTVS